MTIGWASDTDAPAIQALLAHTGVVLDGGDWTGLGRTWLVARVGDQVQACIAYHPGRPLARLDFLCIDERVRGLSKARLVRDITEAALAVAALQGSSFVTGAVSYEDVEFGTFLVKRGALSINEGWLYVAALNDVLKERNEIHGRRKNHNDHNSHPDG